MCESDILMLLTTSHMQNLILDFNFGTIPNFMKDFRNFILKNNAWKVGGAVYFSKTKNCWERKKNKKKFNGKKGFVTMRTHFFGGWRFRDFVLLLNHGVQKIVG